MDYAAKLEEIEEMLDEADYETALQLIAELRAMVENAQEVGNNG